MQPTLPVCRREGFTQRRSGENALNETVGGAGTGATCRYVRFWGLKIARKAFFQGPFLFKTLCPRDMPTISVEGSRDYKKTVLARIRRDRNLVLFTIPSPPDTGTFAL